MYVDVGTATNSCQLKNRTLKSPGADPCTELETRGGMWRYDANKTNQPSHPGRALATGIRNGEGFGVDPTGGHLFMTQHGRDQLHANWPDLYKPEEEATLPSEEVMLLKEGGDYGWPECYYDACSKSWCWRRSMAATEGKRWACARARLGRLRPFRRIGGRTARCSMTRSSFPPATTMASSSPFTAPGIVRLTPRVATTSCSSRSPAIVPPGACEIFADGFAGPVKSRRRLCIVRPASPSDQMARFYVAEDITGRIYRIVYTGGCADWEGRQFTPCPSLSAPAGEIVEAEAKPPEGTHPDAGLPVPQGATQEMVALGDRIYHGQVGGAPCAGCHGSQRKRQSPRTRFNRRQMAVERWQLEGDCQNDHRRSLATKRISQTMPPMGGAQLTADQVSAVAAYVWALSHH